MALIAGLFSFLHRGTVADGQDAVFPAVQVDGQVYYCLYTDDYEPGLSVDESRIDGYITSCVDSGQWPTGNHQANFPNAVGCPYAVVNNVLLLQSKYDDSWMILRPHGGSQYN